MNDGSHNPVHSGNCLGIFAKYWEPGKVKTRLASSIGDTKAARVYEAFVAATIARLSAIECQRVLAFSPVNENVQQAFELAELGNWSLVPQADGHLGERMTAYFDQQFQAGHERVVLLGTDSPNVPLVEVQESLEHLKSCDVVLGPTHDGGYYLIGARKETPPIFQDIPWSTSNVLQATIDRLEQEEISYETLDPWYDVDEIYDLHQLIDDLRDHCEEEPALEILLQHIVAVIEGDDE